MESSLKLSWPASNTGARPGSPDHPLRNSPNAKAPSRHRTNVPPVMPSVPRVIRLNSSPGVSTSSIRACSGSSLPGPPPSHDRFRSPRQSPERSSMTRFSLPVSTIGALPGQIEPDAIDLPLLRQVPADHHAGPLFGSRRVTLCLPALTTPVEQSWPHHPHQSSPNGLLE